MKTYNTAFPFFPEEDIDEILINIKEMLKGNKLLTMGEYVNSFEKEFSNYIGTKYAIATNSCTSALEISLTSLNLSKEDEVIVPVQTFVATGSAVVKAGAKLVFCDVNEDFLIDFESLKKLITEKTKAVIIVHFAGMIHREIMKIKNYLKERNILLIEDAAHAHGATFEGIKAGNIGDFGCFSFYSTKIMTTGEGGMITTNDFDYYNKCASIRNRGLDIQSDNEIYVNLGSNYRVTEIQALLGLYQLKRLEEFVIYRNKIASVYKEELKEFIEDKIIRLQQPAKNSRHAYWRFIVFLNKHNREDVLNELRNHNIKADAPYYPLLHQQPVFNFFEKKEFPNAEKLSKTHISLPIHMLIKEEDARFIARKLKEVLER